MVQLQNISDEDLMLIADFDIEKELRKRGYKFGWHKEETFAGVIYVLVNPAFPSMVKIGYADDIEKRTKILNSNSGLPDPYHIFAIYKVKKRLEDLKLHALIDSLDPSLRHARNREFYEMPAEKAYGILSAIAQINGDENNLVLNPAKDDFVERLLSAGKDDEKEPSVAKKKERKTPKKNLTFSMLSIPAGSELVFSEDESVKVRTIDEKNTVEYEGEKMSLSAAAKKIKEKKGTGNNTGAYQGGHFFKYDGKLLVKMREEIEERNAKEEKNGGK